MPFQCSISGVSPVLLAFMAEPPAQASVGLSALTAFSWLSGGSLAGEATWLQDWPFHLGSAVERGFWAVDGMMVQVSGFQLAANHETA